MYIFTYFDGLLTCRIPPSSASYTLVNKLWETFMNENIKNYVKKKLDLFLRKKYLFWYSTTNFRRQYYQKLRVILCKNLDLYCFKSDYLSTSLLVAISLGDIYESKGYQLCKNVDLFLRKSDLCWFIMCYFISISIPPSLCVVIHYHGFLKCFWVTFGQLETRWETWDLFIWQSVRSKYRIYI